MNNEKNNMNENEMNNNSAGGVQILEKRPATRVFVQNNEKAEKLFDYLFDDIAQKTTIEKMLSGVKDLEVKHLPVDLESGKYLSEGDFLNIAQLSPCRIEMDPEVDRINLVPYLTKIEVPKEDSDEETVTKPFYVYSLHIMGSIIIQTYSDNTQDYIFFKNMTEDNFVMLHVS